MCFALGKTQVLGGITEYMGLKKHGSPRGSPAFTRQVPRKHGSPSAENLVARTIVKKTWLALGHSLLPGRH